MSRAAAKQQIVRIAIAIAAAAVLFLLGWMLGRAPLADLERALATAEARSTVREAAVRIHQAALALEDRNFGTANDHLRGAGAALARLPEGELAGFTPEATEVVREVETTLGGTDLNVAVDVESQRSAVLRFAARLDQAVGAAAQP